MSLKARENLEWLTPNGAQGLNTILAPDRALSAKLDPRRFVESQGFFERKSN